MLIVTNGFASKWFYYMVVERYSRILTSFPLAEFNWYLELWYFCVIIYFLFRLCILPSFSQLGAQLVCHFLPRCHRYGIGNYVHQVFELANHKSNQFHIVYQKPNFYICNLPAFLFRSHMFGMKCVVLISLHAWMYRLLCQQPNVVILVLYSP